VELHWGIKDDRAGQSLGETLIRKAREIGEILTKGGWEGKQAVIVGRRRSVFKGGEKSLKVKRS